MKQYLVRFYKDARGEEPVLKFIWAQDASTQSKFTKLFHLLEEYGPELMMPYARYLKNGIYELRIRGKNEVRVFYVLMTKQQVGVLLHAFKKRTQKMPTKEFEVARQRAKDLTDL